MDEPGRARTRPTFAADLTLPFGMEEQRALPDANDHRQVPAAMALIEPGGGSDLQAALDTVRVHGGCGHCTEYSVERWVDDASPVTGARVPARYNARSSPASSSSVFRSPHDQPAR